MITLKQYLDAIQYRITEGTDYAWRCYGTDAAYLDGHVEYKWSASAIFDRKTQVVYEVSVCDYRNDRCYRLINSDYKEAHSAEAKKLHSDSNIAYDDVRYTELETDEDMLEKLSAIVDGKDYDTRIGIPLELSQEELFNLMQQAHERDMTLNNFIGEILQNYINNFEKDSNVRK